MVLQGGHFSSDFFDPFKRNDTDFGVFQRNGIAAVLVIHDAVQTNDFARHLKPCNLVSPILCRQTGFEKTSPNGIQGSELLAVGEQSVSALDFAAHGHQIIESLQFLFAQTNGHAQLSQIAIGAGDFDGFGLHGSLRFGQLICLGSSF
jgi:hypothetical protein